MINHDFFCYTIRKNLYQKYDFFSYSFSTEPVHWWEIEFHVKLSDFFFPSKCMRGSH